jgi:hypothetical protein
MAHEQKPKITKSIEYREWKDNQGSKDNPKSLESMNFLSTFTFHIMNSYCNALARACLLVVASAIAHFFLMNVGDHILDKFLGYLLDGEGENSPTSHLEETGALEVRFPKKM